MEHKISYFGFLLLALFTLTTCSRRDEDPPAEKIDIYAGGKILYKGKYTPTIWKNGVSTYLSATYRAGNVNSIYISGKDVYAGGYEVNTAGKRVATVWKNNIPQYLTNATEDTEVYSVHVSGNDYYAAGYDLSSANKPVAVVWKNGFQLYKLTDGTKNTMAYAIALSGKDIYVGGSRGSPPSQGIIWKNGEVFLTYGGKSTDYMKVKTFSIKGNDIYAIVTNFPASSVVHKNEAVLYDREYYGNQVFLTALQVDGSDVYFGGNVEYWPPVTPQTWKNGERYQPLNNVKGTLNSLVLSGGVLYKGGSVNEKPVIWKDQEFYFQEVDKYGVIYSLCIVPK